MNEPIIEFKNLDEANSCLDYWVKVLFLDDWIIQVVLADGELLLDGERQAGTVEYTQSVKTAIIKIGKLDDDMKSRIMKIVHEKVLVHELLHLKINFSCVPRTIEESFYDNAEHALIEEMAKSLIMAKYGLDFSYFKNF